LLYPSPTTENEAAARKNTEKDKMQVFNEAVKEFLKKVSIRDIAARFMGSIARLVAAPQSDRQKTRVTNSSIHRDH